MAQSPWDAIGEDYVTDAMLWALADHLGTVRDVAEYNAGTDSTTVVNHLTIDSFGRITNESDDTVDHLFAYTGRERDDDADLYYFRKRWYDADVGQFVSQDPIGFTAQDSNLRRYVFNAPTTLTDPFGLVPPPTTTYARPQPSPYTDLLAWQQMADLGVTRPDIANLNFDAERFGQLWRDAYLLENEIFQYGLTDPARNPQYERVFVALQQARALRAQFRKIWQEAWSDCNGTMTIDNLPRRRIPGTGATVALMNITSTTYSDLDHRVWQLERRMRELAGDGAGMIRNWLQQRPNAVYGYPYIQPAVSESGHFSPPIPHTTVIQKPAGAWWGDFVLNVGGAVFGPTSPSGNSLEERRLKSMDLDSRIELGNGDNLDDSVDNSFLVASSRGFRRMKKEWNECNKGDLHHYYQMRGVEARMGALQAARAIVKCC